MFNKEYRNMVVFGAIASVTQPRIVKVSHIVTFKVLVLLFFLNRELGVGDGLEPRYYFTDIVLSLQCNVLGRVYMRNHFTINTKDHT